MAEESNRSRFGGVPVDDKPVTSKFGGVPALPSSEQTQFIRVAKTPDKPGIGKRLLGSTEVAASLTSGAILEPLAGIIGIGSGVADFISGGDDSIEAASNAIGKIRSLAYQPKSEAGQDIQGMIASPFKKYADAAHAYGGIAQDIAGGSPIAGTIARSTVELAPALLGAGKGKNSATGFRARAEDVRQVSKYAEDVGFDMGGRAYDQAQQLSASAEKLTGGRVVQGQDFEQIQSAVIAAKKAERARVGEMYDEARNTKAGISVSQIVTLEKSVKDALSDFDIESMPIASRRLAELSETANMPANAIIKLNAIAKYRQRLNRNKPAAGDLSQQTALDIIKGKLDSFLDAQFNADMVSGNPEAILKWKMANGAYKDYAERFKSNKVVRQLTEQQATPEEVRQWIYGASAVGAKKGAGEVVARLKGILGEDSPQFAALRQDAIMDIVSPLLDESPNIPQFIRNYDKFKRNNPTLAKELFPDSVSDLDKMRAFAGALEKDSRARIKFDMDQSIARIIFGHGIAKSAMKVSLAGQVVKFMRAAAGKSEKTRIMGDILGYDPSAPLVPISPVAIEGILQTESRAGEK